MSMKTPQLAIFHTTSIPEGVFVEFMQIGAFEKNSISRLNPVRRMGPLRQSSG